MKIVLIGFMCSGKSKVGKLLAQKLGWSHFDTDEMIAKQVGRPVPEIIRSRGEIPFRQVERQAVQLVAMADKSVISTGGGVPLDPENMKDLSQNGKVVWLKVSPDTVLKRAGNIKSRPLINPKNPLQSIKEKLEERIPHYSLAQYEIETDSLSVDQIVQKIISQLKILPT